MKTIDDKKKCDCEALTQTVLSTMKTDGYSGKNEFYLFRSLTQFCKERYDGNYSPDAGAAFLEEKCRFFQSRGHKAVYRNSIARLNQALSGNFHWKPGPILKPYPSSCFDEVVRGYEEYLKLTKKTNNDIRRHVRLAARFLSIAEESGIVRLERITPEIVYVAFEKTGAKEGFRNIKPFFRYAHQRNLIGQDLSGYVPTVARHKPVPTVYSPEEVNSALGAIDRSTATGKRDYCVFLLASRYGIRTSDIAGFTFNNIDYNSNTIHIIQGKTGVPVDFPMTEEISEALNDYINNARPDSAKPNVFLTVPRPYPEPLSPQGIYKIVSKHFINAGIDIRGKRHGAHALRSSLATQLLSEGISYPEVQHVLGHTSPDAATHYIRVEIDRLRECAIDVPALGEGLLSYLEGRASK